VPHNIYLKVHIIARHIKRTIAKIYDNSLMALSPKRKPSAVSMFDIVSYFLYIEQKY